MCVTWSPLRLSVTTGLDLACVCVVEPETGVVVGDACPGIRAANPAAAAALSLAECAAEAGMHGDALRPALSPLFKNGTNSDGIVIIGCLI